MTGTIIFQATRDDLKTAVRESLIELENERKANKIQLFTINQVAKRLGKAHMTIKKLVNEGVIKSTKDGKITEAAINDYLQIS